MLASPEQAVASVKKRDGLLKDSLELVRNKLMNEMSLLTSNVRQHGMSTVDRARFERSVGQVAEAMKVPTKLRMEDIYTDGYLPPPEQRMID